MTSLVLSDVVKKKKKNGKRRSPTCIPSLSIALSSPRLHPRQRRIPATATASTVMLRSGSYGQRPPLLTSPHDRRDAVRYARRRRSQSRYAAVHAFGIAAPSAVCYISLFKREGFVKDCVRRMACRSACMPPLEAQTIYRFPPEVQPPEG